MEIMMQRSFFLFFRSVCICLLIALIAWGCGDSSDNTYTGNTRQPLDADNFITNLYDNWNGVDFSFNAVDGYTDSDGDGQIDTNDAINFVETLKYMGYDLPETSIDGLYENYYTEAGYDRSSEDDHSKLEFIYTENSTVTENDLKNADWSGLETGDLIFVDYDKDYIWDNAAVYMGAFGEYQHAVFIASDYYDRCIVLDLDDEDEIINQDIAYGFSAVKKPAFDSYPPF
ncbi:MAG: hypothetical protein R6U50_09810 [Desulfobacterales bacterium]